MLKIMKYLKKYWWQILLVVIFVAVQTYVDLTLPEFMSKIVDEGIVNSNTNRIIQIGIQMLGLALIGGIATIIVSFFSSRIAAATSRNIRKDVFEKVTNFSSAETNKFSKASLITRTTNDVQHIQMTTFMILRMMVMAPIMAIGGISKVLKNSPSLTWIIAIAVVVLFIIIIVLFSLAMPKFKIFQKLIDKLNLVTRENLTGLKVIRAFNNEEHQEEKFDKANTDLTKLNLFVNKVMILMQPLTMLVMNLTMVAVIWIGSHQVDIGSLQIGDMMAFIQYAMQIMTSFMMLSMLFVMIPRTSISANRIMEVLNTNPIITDPESSKKSNNKLKGQVEFKNVSFTYPDADEAVLCDISFIAEKGKTTAFIGSTGSGKSTLINLIPRFYDVTSGSILVGGIDVRDYLQKDLRDLIGYVPQKGVLFSGTIKSNLKYGNDKLSNEEMRKVSQVAQALDFIEEKDKKFDTHISQGGKNVSGGQKQRLSIARALAKNPEIFIFDDSFSALDFKTDKELRKELKKYTKDATVLIVAQRISTIMNADKIVVLDEGKIVGIGTHKELVKTCDVYKEIALSQLREEEL
ncbi:MAG: ABC transporter ATP-binding protein [Firmicutes bacterium]|nr:ABC transporter ATP-binding protein [Bacillota bacterium]